MHDRSSTHSPFSCSSPSSVLQFNPKGELMPASTVVKIKLSLPTKLYLAANKRAGGLSFNAYMIALLCKDCGVAQETLDYETRPRPQWNKPPEGRAEHNAMLVLPRELADTMRKKLDAMPYPVVQRGYLRTLIENDVTGGK